MLATTFVCAKSTQEGQYSPGEPLDPEDLTGVEVGLSSKVFYHED